MKVQVTMDEALAKKLDDYADRNYTTRSVDDITKPSQACPDTVLVINATMNMLKLIKSLFIIISKVIVVFIDLYYTSFTVKVFAPY